MMEPSKYRTPVQVERIKRAESIGYVWERDSEYRLKHGRGRAASVTVGCLSILTGNVIGSARTMVVYPDGSVETHAQKGNSSSTTFSRSKLTNALQLKYEGRLPAPSDEDLHFN